MTQAYVKTTILGAWPEEKDGQAGYAVRYPDGHQSWCPKDEWERTARPISPEEAANVAQYATPHVPAEELGADGMSVSDAELLEHPAVR